MRALFMAFLALTLSACVHETNLQSLDGKSIGKATIEYEGNSSGTITLERNGLIYKGLWTASKVDEGREIAKVYGVNSRRYKDYQRGLGVNYLRRGYSTLESEQGTTLSCEFTYRSASAKGFCNSDNEYFEFVTER